MRINSNKLVFTFMVMRKHVTQCSSVAYLCVFGQQLSYMTQMDDLYQSLATQQTALVSCMNSLLVLLFS